MFAEIRKFVVAIVSTAVVAGSLGLLPDPADKWTAVVAAFLGAIGVYLAPNLPPVKPPRG